MFPMAVVVLIVAALTSYKLRSFWIAVIVALTLLGAIVLLIDFLVSPVGQICFWVGAVIIVGYLLHKHRNEVSSRCSVLWERYRSSNLLVKIAVPTFISLAVAGSLAVAFSPKTVALWFQDEGLFQIRRLAVVPSEGSTMDGMRLTGVYPFDERSVEGDSWRDLPWDDDIEFYDSAVRRVVVYDEVRPKSCERWFSGFSNCRSFDLSKADLSECVSTANMFYGCESVDSIIFGAGSSDCLQDSSGMFRGCESLKSVNLSSFDFSGCESFRMMFEGCDDLTAVKFGDTNFSKVSDFAAMFYGCTVLSIDCSEWEVASAQKADDFSKGAHEIAEPLWPSGCEVGDSDDEEEHAYTPRRQESKSPGQCLAPGCENRARNKCGYCNSHHLEYCDDPYCTVDKCKVPGCDNVGTFSGYCHYHHYNEDMG